MIAATLELELNGIQIGGLDPDIGIVNSSTDFDQIDFDQINILGTGQLLVGSQLNISLLNGFSPQVGDFFDVLSGDQLIVGNINVNGPAGFGFTFDVLNLTDPVFGGTRDVLRLNVVSAVPEPGTAGLALLVLTGVFATRRHRFGRRPTTPVSSDF